MKFQLITIPFVSILSGLVSGYTFDDAYVLTDKVIGEDFYNFFEWQAIPDPTNGRVNYVDKETSKSAGLTSASKDCFILRADNTSVLNPSGPGRNSVRIKSLKTFGKHVAIFDIRHMPQGCGTWPAIWQMNESAWPTGGEFDILEGANDQSPNAATLHTASECTMPASLSDLLQTGTSAALDCNINTNGDQGCPVMFPSENSYGPAFNNVGGGWYAVERSPSQIRVWFWPRNAKDVPGDIKDATTYDYLMGDWGTPVAYFPASTCNSFEDFVDHNIIINLTLCGDWAGGASYGSAGCPSTCEDLVNNNPSAFTNAYFDFASIRIYQAAATLQ